MGKQLTEPVDEDNQIAVREPTERLMGQRTVDSEKGKAVIEDIQVKLASSNWHNHAVIKIRYDDRSKEKIVLPIYETDYMNENLNALMKYSGSNNLYEIIGTQLPAIKNHKGEWKIYIPSSEIPRLEDLLFRTPLSRVSTDSIKPSVGVPALIGITSILVLLPLSNFVFGFFTGVIAFLFTTPIVSFEMPGKVL